VKAALSHDGRYSWIDHRLPAYISILAFLERVPEGAAIEGAVRDRLESLADRESDSLANPGESKAEFDRFRELIEKSVGNEEL